MRRFLLGSLVLFVAACGGGVKPAVEATPSGRGGNAIPTDQESALLIESLIKTYGEDAVDACLEAWMDGVGFDVNEPGPLYKPGARFRAILSKCVGAPAPADLRDPVSSNLSNTRSSDFRADRESP